MSYTVDIIDTLDDSHTTISEYAEKSSIVLNWNGGDAKDAQNIIGSNLNFTLEVNVGNSEDAKFRHLFTGNETRYKVRFYKTEENETIWTGFLLPDSYSEPYTNATFYVGFEAVDGLGRLKGKKLSDDFYTAEKSVVSFIAKCLELTGLQLQINLASAIENTLEKRYDLIYLDGNNFVDKNKTFDAYKVLEEILSSMLCSVYQVDNAWYVEGFNQRHLLSVSYHNYDYQGNYIGLVQKTRLLKEFAALDTPLIDTIPPYNTINVTHERSPQALPDTIAVEENDGWAVGQGVNADVFPTYWFGNGDYYPKALAPEYKVTLPNKDSIGFDSSKFISLKDKIYVKRFDKFVLSAKFTVPISAKTDNGVTESGLKLKVVLNGNTIYEVSRVFEDKEIELGFDLFAKEAGLMDLIIFQPYFGGTLQENTFSPYVSIESLKLEVIGFDDELLVSDKITDDFTINKDVELPFADDATGFSKAFRLSPLQLKGPQFNDITVPILYGFQQNDNFYSVVDLYGANLVSDNIDSVYYGGSLLSDLEVVYNYQNGEQMVVRTTTALTSGNFIVRRFRTEDFTNDRSHWEQWSDTLYPIEKDRYMESVAKVYRRLFEVSHERVDFTADLALKINDLLYFAYRIPSNYFLTNIAWNIDAGESKGTMVKSIYKSEVIDVGSENQPPIVNAGPDIELPFAVFSTRVEATAFDPDGFIESVKWEFFPLVVGSIITPDQLATDVMFIVEDPTVLRVTVTDNDGATASDTLTIRRQSSNLFQLTEDLYFNTAGEESSGLAFKRDAISFQPDFAQNISVTIKGNFYLNHVDPMRPDGQTYNGITLFTVQKNGVEIIKNELEGAVVSREGDFEFNYILGDVIEITVQALASFVANISSNYIDLRAGYEINSILFQQGAGVITGYPVSQEVRFRGIQ